MTVPTWPPDLGDRVWVVGPPGAGKTTHATAIARERGLPYHSLDAMFWANGWRRVGLDEFRDAVRAITATPEWVLDGQYHQVRDIVAGAAEAVVWVEAPRFVALARLVRRTLHRLRTREVLWNGNRERPFSAVSFLVWAFRVHPQAGRDNAALFGAPHRFRRLRVREGQVRCEG